MTPEPTITVLDTAQALADARAAAAPKRRRTTTRTTTRLTPDYLQVLGQARLDAKWVARFAQERERIVPLLRQMATQDDAAAAAACVALVSLGDASDAPNADRLVRLLSDENSPSLDQSFDQMAMAAELIHATPGLQPSAISIPIRRIADTPGHPARLSAIRAAFALGATIESEGVVDEIVRGAATLRRDPWMTKALATLARRDGPHAVPAAQALLEPPLRDSTGVLSAAKAGDAIVPDLERLLASSPTKDVYGSAVVALATLKRDVTQEALRALDDSQLAYYGATALGIAREGTGDEDAVAALSMAALEASYKGQFATAIARIGGPLAIETLAGLWRQVDEYARIYAVWRAKGITVPSAIQDFVSVGVIDRMPDERAIADAFASGWGSEPKDVYVVMSFVRDSGRFVETLGEDRDIEPVGRHPLVIERLCAVTNGALVVEHVSQSRAVEKHGEKVSTVQFVSGNRVYQVETMAPGRSFDVRAIRAVLNRALSDQGNAARFVPFGQFDTAQYLFGDPRAIAAACERLSIPVGDDRVSYKQFLERVEAFWREAASRT